MLILNLPFLSAKSKLKNKLAVSIIAAFILLPASFIPIIQNRRIVVKQPAVINPSLSFVNNSPAPKTISYASTPNMSSQLWQYLRQGVHYLESSGKDVSPDFVHPGGVAFGPLGFTHIAAKDIILNFPELSEFNLQDVFSQSQVYEEFARCYADLLLRKYLNMEYWQMPASEVFAVLQKAWFLGPGLYKKGQKVPSSRKKRAAEYLARDSSSLILATLIK